MKMTKKAALAGLAALTLATVIATPTYARRGSDDVGEDDSRATSTESRRGKRDGKALDSADLACLSAAVAEREDALLAALDEFNADVKAALTERKSDLSDAYAKTDRKEVREAVKSAWKNYKDAMKSARGELKDDKKSAYGEFKSAAKECGGSVESTDTSAPGEEILL